MIDNVESKIENLRIQECLLNALLKVSFFARNIYETETVISGLCCIKDLIFFENNIVWFWNSLDIQSIDNSVEFVIYFHIRGSFLATFCTSFWRKVHNSKEIVNIQGLFAFTVSYLFISTFSFLLFLHTVSWRYEETLDSFIPCSYLWYKKVPIWTCPHPPPLPSPPVHYI